MKKSNNFNDIEPKNSSAIKSRNNLSLPKYITGNDITAHSTKVYKSDNSDISKKREQAKKKTENIADLIKKVAIIFSATSVGVVSGITILPTNSIVAEIQEAEAFENYVFYSVSLSEFKEGCKVVLYNDFTNREEVIEEPTSSGVFEGVKENMYYTLAVKQGNKTLISKQVYTKTERKEEYSDEPTQEPNISDDPTTGRQ